MPVFADAYKPYATSVVTPSQRDDEVTLRFRRWTQWNGTAYQAGQHAGFLLSVARNLVSQGRADAVDVATGAVIDIGGEAEAEAAHAGDPSAPGFWGVPR